MSKSYSLKTIFSEEELTHVMKIADDASSLKQARNNFETYLNTIETIEERGFETEHLAFQIGEMVKSLYESNE